MTDSYDYTALGGDTYEITYPANRPPCLVREGDIAPVCPTCDGWHRVFPEDQWWDGIPCPACRGTGWQEVKR